MMRDLADILEVLGDAADEVAGLLVVVEAEGQLQQMVEGVAAELGLDRDAQHVAPIGDDGHEPGSCCG